MWKYEETCRATEPTIPESSYHSSVHFNHYTMGHPPLNICDDDWLSYEYN